MIEIVVLLLLGPPDVFEVAASGTDTEWAALVGRPQCDPRGPCEETNQTSASCWNCWICQAGDCRRWFPDDEELRRACLEAARDRHWWCLHQIPGTTPVPSPPPPRPRADLDGDGKVTSNDFTVGLDMLLKGEWQQTQFFEFLGDFFD